MSLRQCVHHLASDAGKRARSGGARPRHKFTGAKQLMTRANAMRKARFVAGVVVPGDTCGAFVARGVATEKTFTQMCRRAASDAKFDDTDAQTSPQSSQW